MKKTLLFCVAGSLCPSTIKKIIISTILAFVSINICLCQVTFTGKVVGDGKPLAGVEIVVKGKLQSTVSKEDGTFSIECNVGETIVFSVIGYSTLEYKIGQNNFTNATISMPQDVRSLSEVVVASYSVESGWVGAQLFYNLDGSDIDNAVGAAKVKINTAKRFSAGKFRLNTVGNISKISGNLDTAAIKKNIRSVAQSAQGLFVGLEPLYIISDKGDVTLRTWADIGYKVNAFNNVLVDSEKKNVSLSQFRISLGIEVDAFEFIDGGKRAHIGVEGSVTSFSSDTYKEIFGVSKSSIYVLEWSIVIPLYGQLGILLNQTLTNGLNPVFGAGIIIAQ